MDFEEGKYDIGDRVRIWAVYKHPIGTVMNVIEGEGCPTLYEINYLYEDGREFTEVFEKWQLGLYERSSKGFNHCNCGLAFTNSGGKHSSWCRKAGQHEKGRVYEKRKDEEGF